MRGFRTWISGPRFQALNARFQDLDLKTWVSGPRKFSILRSSYFFLVTFLCVHRHCSLRPVVTDRRTHRSTDQVNLYIRFCNIKNVAKCSKNYQIQPRQQRSKTLYFQSLVGFFNLFSKFSKFAVEKYNFPILSKVCGFESLAKFSNFGSNFPEFAIINQIFQF